MSGAQKTLRIRAIDAEGHGAHWRASNLMKIVWKGVTFAFERGML